MEISWQLMVLICTESQMVLITPAGTNVLTTLKWGYVYLYYKHAWVYACTWCKEALQSDENLWILPSYKQQFRKEKQKQTYKQNQPKLFQHCKGVLVPHGWVGTCTFLSGLMYTVHRSTYVPVWALLTPFSIKRPDIVGIKELDSQIMWNLLQFR